MTLINSTDAAQPEMSEPKIDRCVAVIFNPVSGQNDPEARRERISAALATHGWTCQYLVTTPKETARMFAEKAMADGASLLGVSGGDGTVMEVMSALVGTGVPIAVFPAGTGNLLSVNLDLPHDEVKAAEAALTGVRRVIDLARIRTYDDRDRLGEPKYFAILAGAGYDADVIKGADRESTNRLGMAAYLLSALRNLGRRRARAAIRIDGGPLLRRKAKSVMVANMGRLQGNIEMVPDAVPDDGELDVAMLKAETMADWVRLAFAALRHRLREEPGLEYLRARKVEVRFGSPQPVQLDGEALEGRFRGFEVEVAPRAVEIMAPQGWDG